jgi:hypothetical protein
MLKTKFYIFLHNCIGHPIMGILQLFGFVDLAEAIHNATMHPDDRDEEIIL